MCVVVARTITEEERVGGWRSSICRRATEQKTLAQVVAVRQGALRGEGGGRREVGNHFETIEMCDEEQDAAPIDSEMKSLLPE